MKSPRVQVLGVKHNSLRNRLGGAPHFLLLLFFEVREVAKQSLVVDFNIRIAVLVIRVIFLEISTLLGNYY